MTASEQPTGAGGPTPDPSALRIGDTERNAAVNALGEHMSTGRLDLDEFGIRSAKASGARTVGELRELFSDLPAPHPPLPGITPVRPLVGQVPATVQPVGGTSPAVVDDRTRTQKFVAGAAGASVAVALLLFFTVGGWWWFLLIPLISSVAGGIWGDSWKRPDRR